MPVIALVAALAVAPTEPRATIRPAPGTVSLEWGDEGTEASEIEDVFSDAVQRAMLQREFVPLSSPGHSRYVAVISVSETLGGKVPGKSRRVGGGPSIANWGAQIAINPPPSGELHQLVSTELTVVITLRSGNGVVWRGSAVTTHVKDNASGEARTVAEKLAGALFRNFPDRPAGVISVP